MPGLCRKRDSRERDELEHRGKNEMKTVYFRRAIFPHVLFSCLVVLLRAQGPFKVEKIRGLFLRETISLGCLELWVRVAGSREEPSVQCQAASQETPSHAICTREGLDKVGGLRFHHGSDTSWVPFTHMKILQSWLISPFYRRVNRGTEKLCCPWLNLRTSHSRREKQHLTQFPILPGRSRCPGIAG